MPKESRYYYLDDGDAEESKTFAARVVGTCKGLTIKHQYPRDFSGQIEEVFGPGFDADGLILDLRLDQNAHEVDGEKIHADYRAPALAQEIRNRAGEQRAREYPIVLWSLEKRLKESYQRDNTSHDLFDLIVIKDELEDETKAQEVGKKLIALAQDYPVIAEVRNKHKRQTGWLHLILGFKQEEEASFMDPLILEYFDSSKLEQPVYEYARFLIYQLLDTSGPLIDRLTMAARLGLDLQHSPDAPQLLDEHFAPAKYTGAFAAGWDRWWTFLLEKRWRELVPDCGTLRALDAQKRIEHLKAATGLVAIQASQPLQPRYSTRFWTICHELKKPLDPRNGLLLKREKSFRWQEQQFVSFEAYAKRKVDRRDIDPADRGRLERMKKDRSSQ